jgi:hypothetical protein
VKYLKLQIEHLHGETLYERDLKLETIFRELVPRMMLKLILQGTVLEGDSYTVTIIPRYGTSMKLTPELVGVSSETLLPGDKWIEMSFEEPFNFHEPVHFFTIQIHIKDLNLLYRQDCQVFAALEQYLKHTLGHTLIQKGVIRNGDGMIPRLFTRDDDSADFDKEHFPRLQHQVESLLEFVDEPQAIVFPKRHKKHYLNTTLVGEPARDDICIFIQQKTMNALIEEGKQSTVAERGGVLVGTVYENADQGRHIVEISDLIVGEHMVSSMTQLRYTFESWQAQHQRMQEDFLDKRIVGWYHTHLIEGGIYQRQNPERSKLFFSRDDHFLHKQFFPEPWHVAMVLDPKGNSIFFQWKGKEVVGCDGYYIFEDIHSPT